MMRGYTWFRCPACGHVFKAPDVEQSATVFTMPWPCPKCRTKSYALGEPDPDVPVMENLSRQCKDLKAGLGRIISDVFKA